VKASELVIRAASLLAPGRALDLACGTGRNAIYLSSIGWNVIAIDIDPRVAPLAAAALDVRIMDLEKMPLDFEDASFDLIAIIHYFQPSLFPVVRRLLRPGGFIATSAKMTGRFAAGPRVLPGFFDGWELIHVFEDGAISELIAKRVN
jgi:SAM-dependent methyltransferase